MQPRSLNAHAQTDLIPELVKLKNMERQGGFRQFGLRKRNASIIQMHPGFKKHAYVSSNIIEQEDEEDVHTLEASITNMNYKRSHSNFRNTFMGAT